MKIQKILNFSNNKDNLFFILLCFYPWFLISGPFLSDLIAILFVLFFIQQKIFQKDYQDFKNSIFIIFILFSLYISFNSIFISPNIASIKSSLTFFRFGFFSLALAFLFIQNKHRLIFFFYSLILILIILFCDSVFQKIYGFNFLGIEMQHGIRVSSFFGKELILGSFVFKMMPIILSFIYLFYEERAKILSLIVILISSIIILLSAEKTSLILMIIFSLLFFIIIDYKLKIKLLIVSSFFLLISSIIFLNEPIKKRIYSDLISNSGGGKYIYTKVHDSHFRTAYKMFLDKPFLGHGPKMFRFKCSDEKYEIDKFSCSTHPHNFILQILSETGIIGFLFYMFFYFKILTLFTKNLYFSLLNKQFSYPQYILSSSIIVIFFPLATSGNIFNNWLSCTHFFTIGILLFFLKEQNEENLKKFSK